MNTRLTARSCRHIASRLALPKKSSLRPKLPWKLPSSHRRRRHGRRWRRCGVGVGLGCLFPLSLSSFFLTQQQLRPPSSFSSSCHHLQVPILLFLIPNPTQTVLLHPLFDVSPPPPSWSANKRPPPAPRNPPVPEVPDAPSSQPTQ